MKSPRNRWLRKAVSLTEKPTGCAAVLMLLASILAGGTKTASAATIGWEVKNGLMDGKTIEFNYDILGVDGTDLITKYTLKAKGNLTAAEVAAALEIAINAEIAKTKFGDATAKANKATIELTGKNVESASLFSGTTKGAIELALADSVAPPVGVLAFLPDPDTGLSTLTETGSYSVVGPGLDVNFSAAEGTDADQLAMLFAGELSGKVYGDEVVLPSPSLGQYLIQVDGDGLDYALSAVPESSTWTMMLLGFTGLGFAAYRRARSSGMTTFASA